MRYEDHNCKFGADSAAEPGEMATGDLPGRLIYAIDTLII